MNILSHFYFDQHENQPYYNIGLVLPDLMSMFKRGWKFKGNKNVEISKDELLLAKGIKQHYKRDAVWHNSDFFFENTKSFRVKLEESNFYYPKPRLDFISHIALELCIDKVLMDKETKVVDIFYELLEHAQRRTIFNLLDTENGFDKEGFNGFLDRFIERKFLKNYQNQGGLAFVINRILNRVGLPEIEDKELGVFETVLADTHNCISKNFALVEGILPKTKSI
jgi:hypothetical protein